MTDFNGHSTAGFRSAFLTIVFTLPIIIWREHGQWLDILHNLWRIPLSFALCYIGALFPDIDMKSKSQRIIYSIIVILLILLISYRYYGWAAGVGLFASTGIIFKHRGFLHTRIAAFVLPLPLLLIPLFINFHVRAMGFEFYLSTAFGYLTHLAADGMISIPMVIDETKATLRKSEQKFKKLVKKPKERIECNE
ncbi:metal-dependent hydrolase [candidate division KSB1 bacterium]|nr:metal-dependent hydrolase [candidate division KSB1 bacterium]